MQYTYEQKKEAVRLVTEEHLSYLKAGRAIGGASKTCVLQWVKMAEQHGVESLQTKIERKKYTGEYKVEVVEYMHEHHMSAYTASSHFGIARTQLQRWEKIYCLEGKKALLMERRGKGQKSKLKLKNHENNDTVTREALFEENQRLRMENEYLKKLYALVQKKESQQKKK